MAKLWTVFRREYFERVRSKWFIVATFLGPVFFAAITILPIVMAGKTKATGEVANVIVLDATGTDLGQRVARSLHASATATLAAAPPKDGAVRAPVPMPIVRAVAPAGLAAAESAATGEVMRRERRGYLVLDAGTSAGKTARYAGRNATSLVDVKVITDAMRNELLRQRLEGAGIDPAQIAALTAVRLETRTEKISDRGREAGGGMASFFFAYAIAFLLYLMIVLYGQNILRGVMEEKTTRVAEVVVSSVRPSTLLAGKVLGVGAVALTQMVAWAATSYVLLQLRAPLMSRLGGGGAGAAPFSLPSLSPGVGMILLLFFLLGFVFYSTLFAAIGAMVSSQEDAQQASMPVMILLVASIIFINPILLNPASGLARTMSILPFSAPILMPMRMALIPVPWYEIAGALASVALACAGAIWLSARIYRVGLLMYGKRPSVRELARWVRYG